MQTKTKVWHDTFEPQNNALLSKFQYNFIKNITHPTKSLRHKGMAVYNMNFSPSFSSSSVDISWELKIALKNLIKKALTVKKDDGKPGKCHFSLTVLHQVWAVKGRKISLKDVTQCWQR